MNATAVSGAVRIWLRAEGFSVLALSALLYSHFGASWWIFFGLLLVPDLSMLGYLINPRIGSTAYNLAHNYVLPLAVAIAALALDRPAILPYACIWTAHIGLDRLLGYGLKYPAAFSATHLGNLGGGRGKGARFQRQLRRSMATLSDFEKLELAQP